VSIRIRYDTPALTWDEGLPLGNGVLGALVWGTGRPLKISLDRTDLWDTRVIPEFHSADYTYDNVLRWHREGKHDELKNLLEEPYNRPANPTKIPAGRIELVANNDAVVQFSELDLYTATVYVQLGNTPIRIFVHATENVGIIVLPAKTDVTIRLNNPLFNSDAATNVPADKTALTHLGYPVVERYDSNTYQSFRQKGWEKFCYAGYLAWHNQNGERVYAWTITSNHDGTDPLEVARERVTNVLSCDTKEMFGTHCAWWNNYWQKSCISLPNKRIEKQWFLDTYKFGATSRKGGYPITLQGVWTADDGKLPPWRGDYHHDLNTELSYWPCYSGNRLEEGQCFVDWLWDTRGNCKKWTREFFGMPGLNVPMTADINNNQIGGWRQYTHSATTAAWLAHHFYLHWKYSNDREFLRTRAYPYLRAAAVFVDAITSRKKVNGKRVLELSSSPEINDNRPNAWFVDTITNYDLALILWLLHATAELATELGNTGDAEYWHSVSSEFPGYAVDDNIGLLVAQNYPLKVSHRHFSHLMAIHPLGLLNYPGGSQDEQKIVTNSLKYLDTLGTSRWCGYSFAWLASIYARDGDGVNAERMLDIFADAFTLRNSFHCNGDQSGKGYSTLKYRPFTLEGNFAAAAGVQEMLLQSHNGKITVFPAVPGIWRDTEFTTLRAQGGVLVSAQRKNGQVQNVELISETGGRCCFVSPWAKKDIILTLVPNKPLTLTPKMSL